MKPTTYAILVILSIIMLCPLSAKADKKEKLTGLERLTKNNIACTEDNFLHYIRKDNVQVVEDFLNSGFDPNRKNAAGQTSLFVAAINNSLKVAQLLIRKGVEIDATDIDGSTPLMYAAFNKKFKMVELLLKNKADVNKQNEKGWTALMYAVENGSKKTIDALIIKETNYLLRNKDDNSARDIAIKRGYDQLPQYMEDKIKYLNLVEKPRKK